MAFAFRHSISFSTESEFRGAGLTLDPTATRLG